MGALVSPEDVEAFSTVVPEMLFEAIRREGIDIDADRINREAQTILTLLRIGDVWSDDLERLILRKALQAADHLIGSRFPIH